MPIKNKCYPLGRPLFIVRDHTRLWVATYFILSFHLPVDETLQYLICSKSMQKFWDRRHHAPWSCPSFVKKQHFTKKARVPLRFQTSCSRTVWRRGWLDQWPVCQRPVRNVLLSLSISRISLVVWFRSKKSSVTMSMFLRWSCGSSSSLRMLSNGSLRSHQLNKSINQFTLIMSRVRTWYIVLLTQRNLHGLCYFLVTAISIRNQWLERWTYKVQRFQHMLFHRTDTSWTCPKFFSLLQVKLSRNLSRLLPLTIAQDARFFMIRSALVSHPLCWRF